MVALHDRGYLPTEEKWRSTPGKLAKRALEELHERRLTVMVCFAAAHRLMPRAAGEAEGREVNAVIDAMSRVPWNVACSIAKAVKL
jgi:hypothetical protein